MTMLSAPSMPAHIQRHSGRIIADPAMAASTCSQMAWRRAMSASSRLGSIDAVAVPPTHAAMAQGLRPAARSCSISALSAAARIPWFSSSGTMRTYARPMPARSAPFSTHEWLPADAYTTSGAASA
jgi:hypothetical protein